MIIHIIDVVFQVYMILLLVRILGSWFPEFQRHWLMQFVAFYTDPYLNIFRRLIPPIGMLDISPVIAFFCLGLIEQLIKIVVSALLS
jgi:YggT family protein